MIRMWISIIGGMGLFFYFLWSSANTEYKLPSVLLNEDGNCVECGK